jgi:starch phosphorylase
VIGEQVPPDTGRDAGLLFELLEQQIVPLYYERAADGLPQRWIGIMRASMAAFLQRFSSRRMLHDYASRLYELPGYAPQGPTTPDGTPQRSATA